MKNVRITIDATRVTGWIFVVCISVELALVVLDYWVNWRRMSPYPPMRRLFNVAREDALASWFQVTQTFVIAMVLAVIALVARRRGDRGWRFGGWVFAAVLFAFLAADDGAMIHERIGSTTGRAFDTEFWPGYNWQLVYLPLLAASGLFLVQFLWRTVSRRNFMIVAIAFTWLAVAIGLDFVEGIDGAYPYLETVLGIEHQALSHFSRVIEEFLEMFAMTLLLVAFVDHLLGMAERMELVIHGAGRASPASRAGER